MRVRPRVGAAVENKTPVVFAAGCTGSRDS